jgi:hypothetical protein
MPSFTLDTILRQKNRAVQRQFLDSQTGRIQFEEIRLVSFDHLAALLPDPGLQAGESNTKSSARTATKNLCVKRWKQS